MNTEEHTEQSKNQKQTLFSLCRFLSLRLMYRSMLILLFVTGIVLSLIHRAQFAPYGIAVVYLLLPSFINFSADTSAKKENNDTPLSILCNKYHYSPSALFSYRISYFLCSLLLFIWHLIQTPVLYLGGLSLPLFYLILNLALFPIISRILFWNLHHRLMEGRL